MSFLKNLFYKLIETTWSVIIVDNSIDGLLDGEVMKFHMVKHNYRDRWFADPFVLDVTNDTIELLVEEFYNPINRGRISKMIVDRHSYELLSLKTVLELDTHLSFPFIIRVNGKVYFCPENTEGNEWSVYEYDDKSSSCKKVKVLYQGHLADAVPFCYRGHKLMTATTYPNDNGSQIDVYELNEGDGEYHKFQTFFFNKKIGRNAGNVFEYKGQLYRPAQECDLCYGHALSIQRIIYKYGKMHFEEIKQLKSPDKFHILGIHTLNSYKDVVASDATVYTYPFFGSLLYFLKSIL